MSITGAQLCQDAMFQAGVLGQDGTVNPQGDADVQLVLRYLNRLLDSWSIESLMIYASALDTLPLVASTATYATTLLTSTLRPTKVTSISVTYGGVNYPVELIDDARYNDIALPTLAAIPQVCNYTASYPAGSFVFFPVPFATMTANIYVERLLTTATVTTATTLTFPPGYERALVACLAKEICPPFYQPITTDIAKAAMEALSVLKKRNWQPFEAKTPFDQDNSYDLAYICRPW